MRVNIWVRVEDAVKGKIEPNKYWLHAKHVVEQKLLNTDDLVQVSITADEFAKLEDSKTSENDRHLDKHTNIWESNHWLREQYNRNRAITDQVDELTEVKTSSIIKEYLAVKGGDFTVWWESKSIAERQIVTGYFGH